MAGEFHPAETPPRKESSHKKAQKGTKRTTMKAMRTPVEYSGTVIEVAIASRQQEARFPA